ncbi:hypothetical protein LQ772_06715 [Frateuria edaphi]|uniref:hypothetical protein n=1 Tax=Frateuria edaphi TaxID=2898793 RepID=UPI001E57E624|nr:hypothetical protein [Frateuria edaphi]UGB46977.1 hypothetical protein LQ772_06715 [Frateuria edaphi]
MHTGKLMARLNAKNVRFDAGSGGTPELTPADISAALAMVPPGLGRELLCRVWWPDGAALTSHELRMLLDGALFGEWRERADAMVIAQIRVATAGESTTRQRMARHALDGAKARMWPSIGETYARLRDTVVEELCDPRLCPDCKGHGHTTTRDIERACTRCEGSGHVARGPTWRAERLGMKHPSYLALWDEPYRWLLARCTDELQDADRAMVKALGPVVA